VWNLTRSSTPPGTGWTVRDAAAHLAGSSRRYAALLRGEFDVSDLPLDKAFLDARARSLIADNPETDPKQLAVQLREGFEELVTAAASRPADQPIAWYAGFRPHVAASVAIYLGEPLLHGYDIAHAVGLPWPIDQRYAALALRGYRLIYPALFQPWAAAGRDAIYRIDIDGTEPFCAQIAGDTYEDLPDAPGVDCVVSADPVTALLVISGRLSRWSAVALGSLRFTGERPEIGPRFFDLFVFP
jgi:uncharacterized protein (TIGR03083 family)